MSTGADDYAVTAEFYDHVPAYKERSKRDVPFFVEMAKEADGQVLEVGAGTGRVLIPLARAGIRIAGVDASESMLAICEAKLAHEPDEVRLRAILQLADMLGFHLPYKRFKLAIMPFRSFQHMLTIDEQLSCLARVYDHLDDNGRLIVDVFDPDVKRLAQERWRLEEPEFEMPDGWLVSRTVEVLGVDFSTQTMKVIFTYRVTSPHDVLDVQLASESFVLRYYFRHELEHLLVRAGFLVDPKEVYADYDRVPYGQKYPKEIIIMAHKE